MSETNAKEDKLTNIDRRGFLPDQISELYMSIKYSDVTFIVENQRIPAHKCILAAANKYFEGLLYGGLSESNQKEIELKVPLEAFKILLRFIYCGQICLKEIEEGTILDILVLANAYGFVELETVIVEYLTEVVDLQNVWAILKIAWLCELQSLKNVCYNLMDMNASKLMTQESFKHLPMKLLQDVLVRDSFLAPEFEIFAAVSNWCQHNSDADADSVLSYVRFPLMSDCDLSRVRKSGIVKMEKLMDAIEVRAESKELPYRVWPEENMVALKFGSKIIKGSWGIDPPPPGGIFPYDLENMENSKKPVTIKAARYEGIVLELGIPSIINHIKIKLNGQFTYFLEVSENQSQWDRVVDYRDCVCKDLQSLFFTLKYVKYIKLVGTGDKGLTITALKATYMETIPKQINGFIAATIKMCATKIEGGVTQEDTLLKCSCRTTKAIIRQLDQPYFVSSLHLLFSINREYSYNYSVDISTNEMNWSRVGQSNGDQNVTSWIKISFTPCPVVFIKISSRNSDFNSTLKEYIVFEEA